MTSSGNPSDQSDRQAPGPGDLRDGFYLLTIHVQPHEGLLQSPRGEVRLEPKVMEVLLVLAEHQGTTVTRDHLLTAVWKDTVVTDDALARCIYQLRHELGRLLDPNQTQPVIQTLRKRGFKLLLPIRHQAQDSHDPPCKQPHLGLRLVVVATCLSVVAGVWWLLSPTSDAPAERLDSIAVLPFDNMTGEAQYDHLANGFSEQLSHALANVPKLRVAARTSAFYFKDRPTEIPDIAEQLNVEALLEGSLRTNGALLRVTVQLVRDDGFHIWSREYDRPLADVLRLQSDIAREVLSELGVIDTSETMLVQTDPVDNYQAYDLYLRGRLALRQRDQEALAHAIELFQQAIAHNADYALAYTGLADAYSLQLYRGLVSADMVTGKVDAAIDRALLLDDELAEAHASRGLQLFSLNNFAAAEPHLRQAVALNSNYVNAHVWLGLDLVLQDRFAEAIDAYLEAQKLDPLDPALNRNLGGNLLLAGRPEEGFIYLERAQKIAPTHPQAYQMLAGWGVIYGRLDEALKWSAAGLHEFPDDVNLLTHKADAYVQLGRWQAARTNLEQAWRLEPENQLLLEQLFYFHLATANLTGIDELLQTLGGEQPPYGADPPFGKRRIVLRWLLLRHLLEGQPETVIIVADALPTDNALTCGAFGEPGARLYLARALQLTGQARRADELLAECIADVNRIQTQGGTYPKSLYRMAITLALAGQTRQAADLLQSAVDLGWRAYWHAWHDPLWAELKQQAPFAGIFRSVYSQLQSRNDAVES